jgi:hypothetical protein
VIWGVFIAFQNFIVGLTANLLGFLIGFYLMVINAVEVTSY